MTARTELAARVMEQVETGAPDEDFSQDPFLADLIRQVEVSLPAEAPVNQPEARPLQRKQPCPNEARQARYSYD